MQNNLLSTFKICIFAPLKQEGRLVVDGHTTVIC